LGEPLEEPILEPSAGEGAIADFLQERGYQHLILVEKNEKRRQTLSAKGHAVAGIPDFLAFERQFSTIVMNPPFEAAQDVDHITHAFEKCLAPGGKLVSVCSEGPFFRQGDKFRDFRNMIALHGYSIKLPTNSFAESGTGVNCRLVVLEKDTL
jgi:tRNA1(Val) A37 N6-methylase TrmN6